KYDTSALFMTHVETILTNFLFLVGVDGEREVGKSGLIYKFAKNDFKNGIYEETLQVYVTTTLIHLDNYTIKVEFLET
ncbi:45712_t:CDS:1, partial [Gigaspora margarita]